jgi:hypothetical protein
MFGDVRIAGNRLYSHPSFAATGSNKEDRNLLYERTDMTNIMNRSMFNATDLFHLLGYGVERFGLVCEPGANLFETELIASCIGCY